MSPPFGIVLSIGLAAASAAFAGVDVDRDVVPILAEHCYACHGPDGAARRANLRLDRPDDARDVLAPDGDLLTRITATDPDVRMPPPETGPALTDAEVATLRRWIDAGAPAASHWAFRPPRLPAPPAVRDDAWPAGDLDRFVLARLEADGNAPNGPADRATQLRRVTFDLTGLPPTPDAVAAFVADARPDAYERAVDALLATPEYGEHLAGTWLDAARYADTNGYQNDFGRAHWPWRDWVIDAFNANLPYDDFVVQQLAGDLLPDATPAHRLATGFLRNHRTVTEAGSLDEEWRVENVVDRTDTTATVFLGLTAGCARCHDHKFDPITQEEYYRLYAFFNTADERGVYEETRGNVGPQIVVPGATHADDRAALDAAVAVHRAALADLLADLAPRRPAWIDALRAAAPPPDPALLVTRGGNAAPNATAAPRITLDGAPDSYVDLGQSFAVEQDDGYTLAAWVRPADDGIVLSKMADDNTYRGFDILLLPDRRVAVHLIHDWPRNAIKVITDAAVPADAWTHIAVRYDGSRTAAGFTITLNGRPAPHGVEVDALDGTVRTETPLRLGRRHYAPRFRGVLADVRCYGRRIDDAELEAVVRARARTLLEHDDENELHAVLASVFADELPAARHALLDAQRALAAFDRTIPTAMILSEQVVPRPTYVLDRGRYDAPIASNPLTPAPPAVLGGWTAPDGRATRLDLARWIVAPEHPLTARVEVNRQWQRFFGVGLVETAEDFGVPGDRPSHPALLDWLAIEFVRSGWDLKQLQKTIVMSATYRQSSRAPAAAYRADPKNRRLARGPRFRLPAEALRDQALAVSGLLVRRLGGPPTRPYQPEGLWTELAGGAGQGPYVQDQDDGLYRRSLYIHRKRTVPHPALATFDAPSWELCQVRRARTNTPLQALALLNDVTYVEAARALAQRMLRHADDPDARLAFGFRLVTAREPDAKERTVLRRGLDARLTEFADDPEGAAALLRSGASTPDTAFAAAELAAYTLTASVLLNLDETVTKE